MRDWKKEADEMTAEGLHNLITIEALIAARLGDKMLWKSRLSGWIPADGKAVETFADADASLRKVILLSHRFDAMQNKWGAADTILVQSLSDLNDAIEKMELEDSASWPDFTNNLYDAIEAANMMLSVSTLSS